jgi:SAM-dependent methyltransferase
MNPYETDRYLAEYLLFHFGQPEEILPWPDGPRSALGFTHRTVMAGLRHRKGTGQRERALDLGCAVGGACFALAGTFADVVGVDYSHRFIEAARILASGGAITYDRLDAGGLAMPWIFPAISPASISFTRRTCFAVCRNRCG